ncbi:hypothetical protein [Nitrosomonas sp. Nm132]|uniref:hypothetical protein n=1 Tax=Nitrosomonas sp. Nm132 TaxID=1881053 RepID=UPI00115F8086|nr:hypothetical protein [Nitrosomonas sp. Nm132]
MARCRSAHHKCFGQAACGKGDATLFIQLGYNYYMPRLSRTVFAGIPQHITRRGNRRENVFSPMTTEAPISAG